jgi:hypothetical protein
MGRVLQANSRRLGSSRVGGFEFGAALVTVVPSSRCLAFLLMVPDSVMPFGRGWT